MLLNIFYKILDTFNFHVTQGLVVHLRSNLGCHVFNLPLGLEGADGHEQRVVERSLLTSGDPHSQAFLVKHNNLGQVQIQGYQATLPPLSEQHVRLNYEFARGYPWFSVC